MACKEISFTVNANKYRAMEWPPTVALPMLFKLLKYCGPMAGTLLKMAEGIGKEDKIQEALIAEGAMQMSGIQPERLTEIIIALATGVFAESKGIKIEDVDIYFGDFPADLFPVAVHSAKVQFSRFLAGSALVFIKDKMGSQFPKT